LIDGALFASAVFGCLAGSAVGLFAGLVPGLHANNLAQATLANRAAVLGTVAVAAAGPLSGHPEGLVAGAGFLFGLALGHSFTDEIPAVFLGAPDPDTALSVLPGHRLLLAGLGPEAVRAAALGSLLAVALCLPLVPLLTWLMGEPLHFYEAVQPALPFLLVAVAAALILSETGSTGADGPSPWEAKALACGVLALSAALGEVVMFEGIPFATVLPFGGPASRSPDYLLALFAGLFGLPTLFLSIWRPATPLAAPQAPAMRGHVLRPWRTARAAGAGTLAGAVFGWLPGVGAAQAATLATLIQGRAARGAHDELRSPEAACEFLVMQSAVGAANLIFNLVALCVLLRVRSGTMAAVAEVGGDEPGPLLYPLIVGALLCLPICYAGALWLGAGSSRFYARMPARKLSICVAVGLVILIGVLEGTMGLAIAGIALVLGLVPPLAGIKRVHLMGAVLLPVAVRLAGA
jgi:putative membrane protein